MNSFPYIYFNKDTFINGEIYTLNIKADKVQLKSLITKDIIILDTITYDKAYLTQNSTYTDTDKLYYIPHLSPPVKSNNFTINGIINGIYTTSNNIVSNLTANPDFMFDKKYYFNFRYDNTCIFSKLNNIPLLSFVNTGASLKTENILPLFNPSSDNQSAHWDNSDHKNVLSYNSRLSPINIKPVTDYIPLEVETISVSASEYQNNVEFDLTSINLSDSSTNTIYFEKNSTSELADVCFSYQSGVNIKNVTTNNLYYEKVTIIDKATGLSNETIEIDQTNNHFKIKNEIAGTFISFYEKDIIFNGDLIIDLVNPYNLDIQDTNLLNIYLSGTTVEVKYDAVLLNVL
jgi:hypothetical protein